MRHRVVLPAPLVPTSPIRPRPGMRHDRSRKRPCPPKDLAIDSTAITRELAHALHGFGCDLHHHPHLARLTVRVLVLAHVLLGQRIDVSVGALLSHLTDASANLHVAVRVVGILSRQRHTRVRFQVAILHAAAGRVDAHVRAVEIAPHRRHLRPAIRPDGGEVAERFLVEDVAIVTEIRCHAHFLPALSCSSTEKACRIDFTASVPPIRTPMSSVSAISASVAPWSRTSSTRWSIQSKQFCETATASAVSSLCFFESAPSAKTSLPISPYARYTFIGDFSIRPLSRFFSAFRSCTCMDVSVAL